MTTDSGRIWCMESWMNRTSEEDQVRNGCQEDILDGAGLSIQWTQIGRPALDINGLEHMD